MDTALSSEDLRRVDSLFKDLYIDSEIIRLKHLPDPTEFYREFVTLNRPCVIEGACSSWPALHRWTNEYLKTVEVQATVAATPDGWADAVRNEKFCLPHETQMRLKDFIEAIEHPRPDEVLYIQKQNSNLNDELDVLWKDIPSDLKEWGEKVFGADADACNFWMGDRRAITSMHKDHYENLYVVVRGYKTFTLCPPHSVLRLPHKLCKNFIHRRVNESDPDQSNVHGCDDLQNISKESPNKSWVLEETEGETLWIDGQPGEWPNIQCQKVVVKMGDVLYLPSLWFHQVEQSHQCIAVNFWFDMKYDQKYCYFKMAELLNPTIAPFAREHLSDEGLR